MVLLEEEEDGVGVDEGEKATEAEADVATA